MHIEIVERSRLCVKVIETLSMFSYVLKDLVTPLYLTFNVEQVFSHNFTHEVIAWANDSSLLENYWNDYETIIAQ